VKPSPPSDNQGQGAPELLVKFPRKPKPAQRRVLFGSFNVLAGRCEMNVQEFLRQRHIPFEVLDHEPTFDAQHMAHAVHAKGETVAKPVLLRADHGYRYVTAIVPASQKIDLEEAGRSLG
jgi:hypothetical protein